MSLKAPDRGLVPRQLKMNERAVCLLSGGVDSATVLGIALSKGYECTALSFEYGQRHRKELNSSLEISRFYGIDRMVARINLSEITSSALTGQAEIDTRSLEDIPKSIPNTYVPARNIIFLSIAASYAESRNARHIFIGANAVDYSGYPDCRPDFYNAFETALNLGTIAGGKDGFMIHVPLQYLTKAEIIKAGTKLGVPYHLTTSCYSGHERACGKCDSCLLRLQGFMEAGIPDPVEYETYPEFYRKFMKERD